MTAAALAILTRALPGERLVSLTLTTTLGPAPQATGRESEARAKVRKVVTFTPEEARP